MRKILLLCLLSVAFLGCGRKTIIGVSFPEAPIELATNADFGMELINYYNILQLPDGTYRMYFSGYKADECGPDWDNQNLYYAESEDGFHYELKGKVMDSIVAIRPDIRLSLLLFAVSSSGFCPTPCMVYLSLKRNVYFVIQDIFSPSAIPSVKRIQSIRSYR